MPAPLPVLVVQRAVPEHVALAVSQGIARVFGGTVREVKTGRILAELVEARDCAGGFAAARAAAGVMSTTESSVAVLASRHLIGLATGSTAMSGLTLAVSTAGFLFLTKRLAEVDGHLQQMQKDVKYIRSFLETRQRAELINAMNTLRDAREAKSQSTREQLLIDSRQELGTLNHHYASQLQEVEDDAVFEATEEYFSLSALGHAHCTAELGMSSAASNDYRIAFETWAKAVTNYAQRHMLKDDPERFLGHRFAEIASVQQIATWMEQFTGDPPAGNWIDELRRRPAATSWWTTKPAAEDRNTVRLLDKLAQRKHVMDGYTSQFRRLDEKQLRPSELRAAVENLDPADSTDGVFVVVDVQPEQKVLGS
jgi:hypothetical protein